MIFLKGRRRFFVLVRRQFVPYLINLPTSISVLYFIHLTQLDEAIKIFNVVFFCAFFLQVIFGTSPIYILIPRTPQKATFHEVSNRAQLYSTATTKNVC